MPEGIEVAILTCPHCEESWHVPNPDDLREECRDCGATLEVERADA